MDVVAAAPAADLTVGYSNEYLVRSNLAARRAALHRRRRAGRARELLSAVAVGGAAIWLAAMALLTLVAR